MTPAEEIMTLRSCIDTVDDELLALLEARCKFSARIQFLKRTSGWMELRDQRREAAVLSRLLARLPAACSTRLVTTIWLSIFEEADRHA